MMWSMDALNPAQAVRLADAVEYAAGSIVSRELLEGAGGGLTLFAFDRGQRLSEHTSPFDAVVIVLDGSPLLVIGGADVRPAPGEAVLMPHGVPHAVRADTRFKMLLALLRPAG